MSYKALYRKYRPQSFADVSDQEHITRTLKNALKEGKVSHAYLFSGPRGVGKTSVAKIFAKAVNCTHNMSGEPCNECDICNGITDGSISDVVEIDAASNNGVDEIRDLRDKVKYLPSQCRYKVYIIDEVHMLTTAAFNALLKTLEEPPKHVIFILCTTEPQKVPATIQSRCQRFEFHLIGREEIEARIKEVARYEYIQIDDEAIKTIAEVSEGGMRDALSLLDQAEAYSKESHITLDDVLQVSGKLSNDILINLATSIQNGNALDAITTLDALLKIGKEIPKIMNGLVVFYKDILVIKNVKPDLMKVGYNSEAFRNLVQNITNKNIYQNIDILVEAISEMRYAENQRLYTEIAFIKMADTKNNRYFEPYSEQQPQTFTPTPQPQKPKQEPKVEPTPQAPIQTTPTPKPVEVKDEPKEEPATVVFEEPTQETTVEEQPVEKPAEEAPRSIAETKGTFDITIVEKVLNGANKQFKKDVIDSMPQTIRKTRGTDLHEAALLLQDATVQAASDNCLVLTYDEVSYCNLAMKKANRDKIIQIFSKEYNKDIDFIAIPFDTWKEVSDEFIKLYRANRAAQRRDFIKLTPVYVDGLRISSDEVNQTQEEDTPDEFSDFISSFDGIIEVK